MDRWIYRSQGRSFIAPRFRIAQLSLAAGLAFLAPSVVLAQSAPSIGQATQAFSIPAQPLGSALGAYASQSGRQVLFSEDLVRGRTAPAVNGNLTPGQALERLLAGSGISSSPSGNGSTITLHATAANTAQAAPHRQAQSQEAALSEVFVTASGTGVSERDAPASVSVITREDIESKPVNSVSELLGTLPGVTGGFANAGAGSKITFRGLPQEYTLILVDGKRIGNSSLLGHRPDTLRQDLDWVAPEDIERIEVVRGSMSSLHGSEAMGGVINIITRGISKDKWGGSITSGTIQPGEGGYGDTYQLGINASGPVTDRVGLRLGAHFNNRNADSTERGSSGSNDRKFNGRLDWQLTTDHKLRFDASYGTERSSTDEDAGYEGFGATKLESSSIGITHEGKYGQASSTVSLYYNDTENDDPTYQSKYKEAVLDAKYSTPMRLGVDQLLTAGLQWRQEELSNASNVGNMTIDSGGNAVTPDLKPDGHAWAVFGEDQLFLTDSFTLTLGGRFDGTDAYSTNFSPRAYGNWSVSDSWMIKGGVSTGYRAPNLKERSPTAGTSSRGRGCTSLVAIGYPTGAGCVMLGNADLKPEESVSYEIGASYENQGWSFAATYFNTQLKNMFEQRKVGEINGTWYTQLTNVEKAKTSGIEVSFGAPLHPRVQLLGNLTYMIESENESTGEALNLTPEWTANAKAQWQVNDKLTTHLSVQYMSKQSYELATSTGGTQYASSNTRFALGANYRLNNSLTLNGGIQNLFNRKIKTGDDYGDGSPRTYYLSLNARF